LSEDELISNRENLWGEVLARELEDDWYRDRTARFDRITVPLLSCGNWGGQGLHLRGNLEGFTRSVSEQKWLEMHGGSHWAPFYTDYGVALQKKFFGHFLKGIETGWDKQPRVQLLIRHPGEKFVERSESEWPLARTRWTKLYLDPERRALSTAVYEKGQALTYDGFGDGLTFLSAPLAEEMEITGPVALKLFLSSSTADADVFAVLRIFDPDGKEVVFQGALDPHTPVAQGWLRASHRKLDPVLSKPYRPYHTHDEKQPLAPGEVAELDVEIWPTCIVIPAGYQLGLSIRGKDYEYEGEATTLSNMKNPMKGCGPFVHDDENDRPASVFGGKVTLHFGKSAAPYILLPIIPAD
jgi:predicted acyl esterase